MGTDTPFEITYQGIQYEFSMQEPHGRPSWADLCQPITITTAPDVQYSKEELDRVFEALSTATWNYEGAGQWYVAPTPAELDDITVPQDATDALMEMLMG